MPDLRRLSPRPRFGGVVSRVGAVATLAATLSACSSDAPASRVTTTEVKTTVAATTTTQSSPMGPAASLLGEGWTATVTADPQNLDRERQKRCSRWSLPTDQEPPMQRMRTVYEVASGPIPSVVADVFEFAEFDAALTQGKAFAEPSFVSCLTEVYSAPPVSIRNLLVKAIKTESLHGAQLGYRISGVTGEGLETEHPLVEVFVVVKANRVAVVTLSSTLRFVMPDDVTSRALGAFAAAP